MIERYANKEIAEIFGDANKTDLWQKLELAVLQARVKLGTLSSVDYQEISRLWEENPIDLEWWKKTDKEIHHDLNAFILERVRVLQARLQKPVHEKLTSFDTEETPFLQMLLKACDLIEVMYSGLQRSISDFSTKNRYVPTIARTHGQEAEMKSLGARALTWKKDLEIAHQQFIFAIASLHQSKISGAVGNYGSIDPELEETALEILGFKVFYGSTQILPRVLHAPLAQALCNLSLVCDKIANDIRLNARSGRPLLQEPFKKKQTGSSAMPHKKNPIQLEQIEGLARMAKGYTLMIVENVKTWEERAIEQSCVERVAWPDLFHVVFRILDILGKIISNLTIYRDDMLQEIYEARGVYASSEVKEFLKEKLTPKGVEYEECYRIVQLACFNVFEVGTDRLDSFRNYIPKDLEDADLLFAKAGELDTSEIISIEEFIPLGKLRQSDQLSATEEEVKRYNALLKEIFSEKETKSEWHKLFTPSFLLRNEKILFEKILND